jgi:hypothetical protein
MGMCKLLAYIQWLWIHNLKNKELALLKNIKIILLF